MKRGFTAAAAVAGALIALGLALLGVVWFMTGGAP